MRTLRGRLTLGVLVLLAVILAGLFTAVDLALSARLHADARTRLTDRVALAQQLQGSLSRQQLADRLRGDGVVVRLCQADGSTCATAASDPPPPGAGRPRGERPRRPDIAETATVPVETAGSVIFVRSALPGNQMLTLSLDTTQITDAVNRLIVFEVAGGILALLLAGVASARISRTALRPLEDMTTVARQIAAGDRGQRLEVPRSDSELGRTAAAFDAMLDELEAAEIRMRAFLSDASHELRTPLAGLQANAELLLRENPDRAERERMAVAMVRESRRAARLVDDLLTMARLGQGMPLVVEPVDLLALAGAEVERARSLSPALRFEVRGESGAPGEGISGPGPHVDGDPGRLGQVITNLLDNARHATPPGGTISVSVRRHGSRVLLDVSDTGPGVPPGERVVIFERFGRGDTSRSRHTGGAGLGLPIARGLAEAHHGTLSYVDGGPGATFRLDLPTSGTGPRPRLALTSVPARADGEPTQGPGGGERVADPAGGGSAADQGGGQLPA
ncbi:HAMP domain-containing histidine kinase [Actinoplanes bogorensis]|uniref:histidine kinase n=1 Tax=Paractinoplanes bogorensis TaxID=1610840 RepID=A0ABS5YRI7_9ACTN|nr:HAMP domain-containing sensor histidine kinase [Actinoplanes bogorensis]MBU2664635.1 HAMP domain-containing histidine kinase [Actinoplanes bogorensis]